ALRAAFHARHAELFGHARPDHAIELVAVRVAVSARHPTPALPRLAQPPAASAPGVATTTRLFSAGRWHDAVPVYDREALPAGATLEGPALVREATGTLVLDFGFSL